MTIQKHTIDATGKSLGRVASEAAVLLRGKDDASFERHIAGEAIVEIINASKILKLRNKPETMTYHTYSGHPGGEKVETMVQIAAKKGYAEVFRIAIYGMLPTNRLRPIMMKHLVISE